MPITFDMTGVKKLYTWTPLTCYNTKNTSGTGEASAVLMGEFDRVDLGNVSSITLSDFYSNQIRIGRYWQFIPQGREVYRDDSKNITLYVYSRYSDVGGAGPEGYPMANVVYMYRGFKSVPVKDHETILVTVEATALSAQNDPAYHDFMEAHTIIGQQVHINILPNTISETEYDGLVYQNFFADITNKSGVQKDRFNSFLNFLQSIQLKPDTLFKGN
jgi:hypothetical protein